MHQDTIPREPHPPHYPLKHDMEQLLQSSPIKQSKSSSRAERKAQVAQAISSRSDGTFWHLNLLHSKATLDEDRIQGFQSGAHGARGKHFCGLEDGGPSIRQSDDLCIRVEVCRTVLDGTSCRRCWAACYIWGDVRMEGTGSGEEYHVQGNFHTDCREYDARHRQQTQHRETPHSLKVDSGFSRYGIKGRQRINLS